MDAMVDKSRIDVVTGNGSVSLFDIGYNNCGRRQLATMRRGKEGSFHDENQGLWLTPRRFQTWRLWPLMDTA